MGSGEEQGRRSGRIAVDRLWAVIPVAGVGSRLRPHTHTRPKPLLPVAGQPILGHILDPLLAVGIRRIVLVTGHMGEQIVEYVRGYLLQKASRGRMGRAHAQQLKEVARHSFALTGRSDTLTLEIRFVVERINLLLDQIKQLDQRFDAFLTQQQFALPARHRTSLGAHVAGRRAASDRAGA